MQAAGGGGGGGDNTDIQIDSHKGGQPQIAGNLAPPSESKSANGEADTVRLLLYSRLSR